MLSEQEKTDVEILHKLACGLLNRSEGKPYDLGDWLHELSFDHPFLDELYEELFDAYEHWPKIKRDSSGNADSSMRNYLGHLQYHKLVFTLSYILKEDLPLKAMEEVFCSVPYLDVGEDKIKEEISSLVVLFKNDDRPIH